MAETVAIVAMLADNSCFFRRLPTTVTDVEDVVLMLLLADFTRFETELNVAMMTLKGRLMITAEVGTPTSMAFWVTRIADTIWEAVEDSTLPAMREEETALLTAAESV